MTQAENQPVHPSRRSVITAGSTLLAGFALDVALPRIGHAAEAPGAGAASPSY